LHSRCTNAALSSTSGSIVASIIGIGGASARAPM
jgi:hypothetical protein